MRDNDLLAGNEPLEGWGSQYSGNPKSFALFLPKNCIKNPPSDARVQKVSRPSVIVKPISHTAGPSNFIDSLSQKHSSVSDYVESDVKWFRFDKNLLNIKVT